MEKESLYIQREVDGKSVYFPSDTERAKIGTYTYTAQRMGGAPTLTATLYFERCLDSEWHRDEFVSFKGERFYLDQIPTSSKDGDSIMYKHELTFNSRRIVLDNTLFFDTVSANTSDTSGGDVYRSNMTSFTFYGDLTEFVTRINDSLVYCGLYDTETKEGYKVVIDDDIDASVIKELSFEDKYITEVLQEIYSTFELEYYWVGTICHVGSAENIITSPVIKYGTNDALLSVSKENSNSKIVDMVTGHGSSDNIPYYYPNKDAFGKAIYDVTYFDKSLVENIDLNAVWKWNSGVYTDIIYLWRYSAANYKANIFNGNAPYFAKFVSDSGRGLYVNKGWDGYLPLLDGSVDNQNFSAYVGYISGSRRRDDQKIATISQRKDCFYVAVAFELSGPAAYHKVDFSKINFVAQVVKTYENTGTTTQNEITAQDLTFEYEYACSYSDLLTLEELEKAMETGSRTHSTDTGTSTDRTESTVRSSEISDSSSDRTSAGATPSPFVVVDGMSSIAHDQTYTSIEDKVVILVQCCISVKGGTTGNCYSLVSASLVPDECSSIVLSSQYFFKTDNGLTCNIDDSGISLNSIAAIPANTVTYSFSNGAWSTVSSTIVNAGRIRITGRDWIMPTGYLMPTIFRETVGAERFYYAENNTHKLPDGSGYYEFENPYIKGNPHQDSTSFDDIKPTINGVVNANGELFGEIADIAFDANDNDLTDDDENYLHPYFYIKLHKFDGEFGFDLFAHALASESAYINLIDSVGCPACSFEIQCTWVESENKCYNPVLVDSDGKIVSGDKDSKIARDVSSVSKNNQNSSTDEIWIAVLKDNSTLGIVMPNAAGNFKPKIGEKFVITGIQMPDSLVEAAESRLDAALIEYMSDNNTEKFNYTVSFSRIFLAENEAFANLLNENARLTLEYDGIQHDLSVSSYTVKADDNILSEVSVELTEELTTAQSNFREEIDSIKGDALETISSLFANYKAKISQADILNYGSTYFLRKNKRDMAASEITFVDGLKLGDSFGEVGFSGKGVGRLVELIVTTALHSANFISGMTGEGWRLWLDDNGLSELEVDNLTVRQTMRVFELVIDKIRSVGGQIIVSAANGKVKDVEAIPEGYKLTFENTNQFTQGDLIRCQTFTGDTYKSYWVEVAQATTEYVTIKRAEFDDGVVPEAGDEVVLMGSTTDEKRQNLISISATDDGQPRIDVLNGVKSKSLDGCLRARLGNLDGIVDEDFEKLQDDELKPHGDGLYADNAYLKGTFLLLSGEDVQTKFEATDGKIESTVEGLRDDVTSKDSYLNNPTFAQGLEYWGFNSSTVFYMVGDLWVWADEGVLAAKGSDSEVTTEDRKCVARIIGGYIRQKNADMRMLPTIEADSDGKKYAVPFYVSFLYKCTTAGTLKVYFSGVDKTGFEAFDSLSVETEIDATTGWKHVTYSGMWNGTGDFVMEFSGEINVSMVILTPNEAETFYVKYKTFFEQSDKLVKIAAKQFNADGSVSSEGEIITTAAWSGVFNTDNTLKNTAGLVTATDFDKFEEETEGQFKTVTASIEESAKTFTDWKSGEYASDQSKKLSIADFSTQFASAVTDQGIAKTAQLSTYVMKVTNEKTGKTELESGVLVLGDNIDLRGYTKINDYFQVDTDGKMHAKDGEFSGKLTATEGKIGDFSIDDQGLYSGAWTSSSWNTTDTNTYMHFYPGQLQLQKTETYGTSTVAKIRVGIGAGADPDEYDKTNGVYNINGFCKSALYIYRRMNDGNDKYYPAAKILSDNVYNRDVALYTEGAVVCRGGVLSSGYVMDASEVTEIDFSRGDTVVVVNSAYRQVYLPPLATMQSVMQSTDAFVVRVTIIAQYDNSQHFFLSFEDGESTLYFRDNDGGKKGTTLEMSAGDALQLALIWDGTNYYGQVLRFNT